MKREPDDDFMAIPDIAAFCKASPWTVRSWFSSGRLPRTHMLGTRVGIFRSDLLKAITLWNKEKSKHPRKRQKSLPPRNSHGAFTAAKKKSHLHPSLAAPVTSDAKAVRQ